MVVAIAAMNTSNIAKNTNTQLQSRKKLLNLMHILIEIHKRLTVVEFLIEKLILMLSVYSCVCCRYINFA